MTSESFPIEVGRRATGETATAAPRSASNAWWGMLLFVVTEAALFLTLLSAYFYLRWRTPGPWPPGGITAPTLMRPVIMTGVLLASSVPTYLAEAGIRRGNTRRLRLGLLAAIVLGLAFLGLQAWEYSLKVEEFTPRTNAYGSVFYTTVTLHGTHVVAGLLLLSWALFRAFRGAYTASRHLGVQLAAIYWHFVDAVWVAVFLSLYLSPRL